MLRRLLLPLFARFNPGDITIRHHFTGEPVRLHSFRHKGYWFYGRERERTSMRAFSKLVRPGDTVLEVGGHIGYVTAYFAYLVGSAGHVFVFEPGPNNLPYLRRNVGTHAQVSIIEAGVGSASGHAAFFTEDLTGQNNSFVKDFEHLRINREVAGVETNVTAVQVEVVTLDAFASERKIAPSFVKIDVEGFELEVLKGAKRLLADARPTLMVEVQAEHEALSKLAEELGYLILDETLSETKLAHHGHGNTFWVHKSKREAVREACR
jgi:FkbM family methyltransferase